MFSIDEAVRFDESLNFGNEKRANREDKLQNELRGKQKWEQFGCDVTPGN